MKSQNRVAVVNQLHNNKIIKNSKEIDQKKLVLLFKQIWIKIVTLIVMVPVLTV